MNQQGKGGGGRPEDRGGEEKKKKQFTLIFPCLTLSLLPTVDRRAFQFCSISVLMG